MDKWKERMWCEWNYHYIGSMGSWVSCMLCWKGGRPTVFDFEKPWFRLINIKYVNTDNKLSQVTYVTGIPEREYITWDVPFRMNLDAASWHLILWEHLCMNWCLKHMWKISWLAERMVKWCNVNALQRAWIDTGKTDQVLKKDNWGISGKAYKCSLEHICTMASSPNVAEGLRENQRGQWVNSSKVKSTYALPNFCQIKSTTSRWCSSPCINRVSCPMFKCPGI